MEVATVNSPIWVGLVVRLDIFTKCDFFSPFSYQIYEKIRGHTPTLRSTATHPARFDLEKIRVVIVKTELQRASLCHVELSAGTKHCVFLERKTGWV